MSTIPLPPPLLTLSGISKHYRVGDCEVPALRQVDLSVPAGAFMAVRGPSGSGKTTLLNICGLIDDFDAGEYHLNGEPVSRLKESERTLLRRSTIGFIFQSYNLIPVMTVRENVEYPLLLAGMPAAARRAKVDAILQGVGLAQREHHRPDLLSGGQRQRVAIARALVKAPRLVIADEPTANLDTATASQIIDLMRALGRQQGVTFLIATHDERMSAHCNYRCSLTDGVLQ